MGGTWKAILKGLGRYPTRYLLRWSPTLKNLLRFDLLEVMRCEADGGVVTLKASQSLLSLHGGHKIKSPCVFSIWELFLVQIRGIR